MYNLFGIFTSFLLGPKSYSFEEQSKRLLSIFFMGIGFVVLGIFGIYNIFIRFYTLGLLCFILSGISLSVIFIIRFGRAGIGVYRFIIVVLGLFFIYLGTIKDTHGYRILWLYTYPLMSFYLLGKKEGMIYTLLVCFSWVFILQFTETLIGENFYSLVFKIRFLISLFVVILFSFVYEFVRTKYQNEKEKQTTELINTKHFIENILEYSPIAIQNIDKDGICIYINNAYAKILEIKKEEIIGKNVFLNESIIETGLIQKFNLALQGESSYIENIPFRCSISKKKIIMNVSLTPIKNYNGKIDSFIAMFYDNTEKAIAERTVALDLIKARNIQNNIISSEHEEIEDLHFEVFFQPMMQVGGDIYDIYKVNEKLYRIFIADATGHGVQAALTTMLIKSEYDKLKVFEMGPSIILKIFNTTFIRKYYKLTMFFTCIILDLNLNDNSLTFSSAGHPPQYLINKDIIQTIHTKGKMVGLIEDTDYNEITTDFPKNSKLLLFTDGVYEEFSEAEEEFGLNRLENTLKINLTEPNKIIINKIIEEGVLWRGNNPVRDDITIIGIEY